MRNVTVKELDRDAFLPYGTYARMLNPDAVKIGEEPIEFYRDMVQLDLGSAHQASFSICRVLKREPVVDVTEFHSGCGEAILPLDGDVFMHVAPATPDTEAPTEQIEIFRVPRGTLACLRPGVWHHAPFALDKDCVNVLIVLPERTYARDCYVCEIPESARVAVKV